MANNNTNHGNRWTSRKFWLSLIGNIAGLVALFGGPALSADTQGAIATVAAGAALMILSTLGYIKVEGEIDKVRATAPLAGPEERPERLMPPAEIPAETVADKAVGLTLLLRAQHPDWSELQIRAEVAKYL